MLVSGVLSRAVALALVVSGGLAGGAMALEAGDAAAGAKVFKKCVACHTTEADGKSGIGPNLNGVFGRTAGTLEGFGYSDAMKAAGTGGRVWNDETIAEYLRSPKTAIPKNKMAFVGLKKDTDLANVIAYLKEATAAK